MSAAPPQHINIIDQETIRHISTAYIYKCLPTLRKVYILPIDNITVNSPAKDSSRFTAQILLNSVACFELGAIQISPSQSYYEVSCLSFGVYGKPKGNVCTF